MLDRFAAHAVARITNLSFKREDGASAVEYGLLVAAIAAVIVVVVFGLGQLVQSGFSSTSAVMSSGVN
jgi:pilus assembly protein Flp/PilA